MTFTVFSAGVLAQNAEFVVSTKELNVALTNAFKNAKDWDGKRGELIIDIHFMNDFQRSCK